MGPEETTRLIEAAGGDSAFAKLLGITETKGYLQRVNNWKRRGIPSEVVLDHYDQLQALRRLVPAA